MRLIDLSNGQMVNADRIVRVQYLTGLCPEIKVWLAGHSEPIVRTGEMATTAYQVIRDAENKPFAAAFVSSASESASESESESVHNRSASAFAAALDRHAREAEDEAGEIETGGEADLATANLLRVCAMHLRESKRRLGEATPIAPVELRRFRWPRGGQGEWLFGVYFPRQDRFESETAGHAGLPVFAGLEWIDPKPGDRP